jgi:hypothetical protein
MSCAVHDDAYIGCAANAMLEVKHALGLIEQQITHYETSQSNTYHDRALLDATHEMITEKLCQLESLQRFLQEQQVDWKWNSELLHRSRIIQHRLQGFEITILTAMHSPCNEQQTTRSSCSDCLVAEFWQNHYQAYVPRPLLAEWIEQFQCTKHQRRSDNPLFDL